MNLSNCDYREYKPCSALDPYVECFWTKTSTSGETTHTVLPDGCIDIVFTLSSENDTASQVVGAMTRPITIHSSGLDNFVAVRFRPGDAWPFFKIPMHELTDDAVDLNEFQSDASDFTERMRAEASTETQVRILETHLLTQYRSLCKPDWSLRWAVKELPYSNVAIVSKQLDISRQHLGRMFRTQVGFSPKHFSRIARMRQFLNSLHEVREIDWSAAAVEAGYYDQSHLINECRSITGRTPMFHFSKTR